VQRRIPYGSEHRTHDQKIHGCLRTEGWIEELPGANTQGSTLEEARDNLKEAVRLVLDANRQLAVDHSGQGAVVKEEMLVSV
jgi:hypothetical protein